MLKNTNNFVLNHKKKTITLNKFFSIITCTHIYILIITWINSWFILVESRTCISLLFFLVSFTYALEVCGKPIHRENRILHFYLPVCLFLPLLQLTLHVCEIKNDLTMWGLDKIQVIVNVLWPFDLWKFYIVQTRVLTG